MGINELWEVLKPFAEFEPIVVLRDKTIAIDLPNFLYESIGDEICTAPPLNNHLLNIFYRVSYLIMERITPIFVLGNKDLKRADCSLENWRVQIEYGDNLGELMNDDISITLDILIRSCLHLLDVMGVQVIRVPDNATAYCAHLNERGLVDGVLSSDSNCIAHGALMVYRNISMKFDIPDSRFAALVEIYDLRRVYEEFDFGPNKAIVLALLCGCDLQPCRQITNRPEDVLEFISQYEEKEILDCVLNWRQREELWTQKNRINFICGNCGHFGCDEDHQKYGCGMCNTEQDCVESQSSLDSIDKCLELRIRKKALEDPTFPQKDLIATYLKKPRILNFEKNFTYRPNIPLFVTHISLLLKWGRVESFCRFLPFCTRALISNSLRNTPSSVVTITPKQIIKKSDFENMPYLQVLWYDKNSHIQNILPIFIDPEGTEADKKLLFYLWLTNEPLEMMLAAYPSLVNSFLNSLKDEDDEVDSETILSVGTNEASISPVPSMKDTDELINSMQTMTISTESNKTTVISKDIETRLQKSATEEKAQIPLKKFDMLNSKFINMLLSKGKQFICYGPTPEFKIAHLALGSNRKCCMRSIIKRGIFIDDLDVWTEERRIMMLHKKSELFKEKIITLDDNCETLWLKMGFDHQSLFKVLERLFSVSKYGTDNISTGVKLLNKTTLKDKNEINGKFICDARQSIDELDVFGLYLQKNFYCANIPKDMVEMPMQRPFKYYEVFDINETYHDYEQIDDISDEPVQTAETLLEIIETETSQYVHLPDPPVQGAEMLVDIIKLPIANEDNVIDANDAPLQTAGILLDVIELPDRSGENLLEIIGLPVERTLELQEVSTAPLPTAGILLDIIELPVPNAEHLLEIIELPFQRSAELEDVIEESAQSADELAYITEEPDESAKESDE